MKVNHRFYFKPRPRSAFLKLARRRSRCATVIVCVLACLVITSALIAATVQIVLRARRTVRLEHQLLQTELLCEAGVLRAAGQLKQSSAYAGETWTPALGQLPWDEASVDIRVKAEDDDPVQRVEVIARLGSEALGIAAMQRSHTFTVTKRKISAPSSSEK